MFAGRMLPRDEIVGMVKRHENNDQPAKGVEWKEPVTGTAIHLMCNKVDNLPLQAKRPLLQVSLQ